MTTGPTRATTFPTDAQGRKQHPVASGVCDYFPDALVMLSNVSWRGNEQHNPGTPLHWDRSKSTDEADALLRHFLQRGEMDDDGVRHSAKMAWRALALLQKEIEEEKQRLGDGLLTADERYVNDTALRVQGADPLYESDVEKWCDHPVKDAKHWYKCSRREGHIGRHVASMGPTNIIALGSLLEPIDRRRE